MEDACGVEVGGQLRALRRLLYCGEWIESHALHVYMLHAPDFLGYASAIELAPRRTRQLVERGARAEEDRQRADDASSAGARSTRSTSASAASTARRASASCAPLAEPLERAREVALETVRWAAGFDFPDSSATTSSSRSSQPGEYPIDGGRLVSNRGLDIDVAEYDEHFVEEHVEHSNALHSRLRRAAAPTSAGRSRASRSTSTGSRRWPEAAARCRARRRRAATRSRASSSARSSSSTPRRGAAADRRVRAAGRAGRPGRAARRRRPRRDRGAARVPLPPLRARRRRHDPRREDRPADLAEPARDRGRPARRRRALRSTCPTTSCSALCEQAIRNYDPCISCATHFLTLEVERR